MSQSSQSRKSAPPPRQNPLPAILSALVVVAIFVVLSVAFAIVANHKARAPGEQAELARPYSDGMLTADDGLCLAAW